ncbi:unnamed protein product, partial [Phaeothamnion confervicola]
PPRLESLLSILQYQGMDLVEPLAARKGLHPLVVPLAKDKNGDVIGLLRWPTPEEDLAMPLVRCGAVGLDLLASSIDHYTRRVAAEEDFRGTSTAGEAIRIANGGDPPPLPPYEAGAVAKLGYGVERYLLLRVGPFPDAYEWLVQQHISKGDELSALAAAERANELFRGWGRPYGSYARLLAAVGSRDMEARDAARVALRCPCWGITPDADALAEVVRIAGYESMAAVRQLYTGMAADSQEGKITEGKAPQQVALDRAAHLMDAVTFGHSSWDGIREELAERYKE